MHFRRSIHTSRCVRGLRSTGLALAGAAAAVLFATAAAADAELLPTPRDLEPNVRFWTRVYTEVDGHGGLIHDSEHLDVVYEVIQLPAGASHRSREQRVEQAKRRYRDLLRKLAAGPREGLDGEAARVLALWPPGTSSAELRAASSRLRFQLGQADKFRAGLIRSGRWSDHIEQVMAEHGVPTALVALPHVESSYNPRAYSRVGAAGIWQFTRSTGVRYMRIDTTVDERMDPWKATVAAARLLRDNHRRIGSWPLAITGYNHGVAGMARAVRVLGTDDMGEISRRYKSRSFGFASRNFYAEFLAAWSIHQDPERHFGPIQPEAPLAYDLLETDAYYSAATLSAAIGMDTATLREHNLALLPSVWNGAKLVPQGYAIRIPRHALEVPVETVLASIPKAQRVTQQKRDRYHTVRRGEALSAIARRYGVGTRELVALNNLRSANHIRAGQVLRLPSDGSEAIVVAMAEPPADGVYHVRRGDNLTIIAARFGISQDDLLTWNRLRNRNQLTIGQRLRVAAPVTVVASATTATATDASIVTPSAEPAAKPAVREVAAAEPAAPEPAPAPAIASFAPTVEPEADTAEEADAEALAELEEADEAVAIAAVAESTSTAAPVLPELPAMAPAPESAGVENLPVDAEVVAVRPSTEPALPDPSNYAVTADGRITVQAEETLGHYAEWLEVSATRLRRLNGMRPTSQLVIGRQKKLDFSAVTPEAFVQRRLDYHRSLQEEFFAAWTVTGATTHVIRRGDSLWYLANEKYQVPLWLLRQYNPDIDFGAMPAGTSLVVPLLTSRDEADPAPAASDAEADL
jgi:membrane-bound lytic murein transglycosylase D